MELEVLHDGFQPFIMEERAAVVLMGHTPRGGAVEQASKITDLVGVTHGCFDHPVPGLYRISPPFRQLSIRLDIEAP